jgi:hypothetical protein
MEESFFHKVSSVETCFLSKLGQLFTLEKGGVLLTSMFFFLVPITQSTTLVPRHLKNKEGPLAPPPFSYKLRSLVVADYVILLITLHDIIFQ